MSFLAGRGGFILTVFVRTLSFDVHHIHVFPCGSCKRSQWHASIIGRLSVQQGKGVPLISLCECCKHAKSPSAASAANSESYQRLYTTPSSFELKPSNFTYFPWKPSFLSTFTSPLSGPMYCFNRRPHVYLNFMIVFLMTLMHVCIIVICFATSESFWYCHWAVTNYRELSIKHIFPSVVAITFYMLYLYLERL